MKKLIIFLFFLMSSVNGLTTIESLPYTCSTASETYRVSGNLSINSGNAITISANGITLNGGGNTITFGLTGTSSCIVLGQNVTGLIIDSMNTKQGHHGVHAFSNAGTRLFTGLVIKNSIFLHDSVGSACIYAENLSGTNSIEISNCSLYVNATTHLEGHGIEISGSAGVTTLTGRIHHNKIDLGDSLWAGRSSCAAFMFTAGNIQIDSNNVYLKQAYQGEGIRFYGDSKNHVYGNNVYMYGHNTRGIMMDGNSDSCNVHDNYIYMDVADVPSGGSESQSYGIRVRFGSDSNSIYNNTIMAVGGLTNGICIGGAEAPPNQSPKNNYIYSNTITSNYYCVQIYDGTLDSTLFENNKYISTGSDPTIFARTDASATKQITFSSDTFTWIGTYAVIFNDFYGSPIDPILFLNCNIDTVDVSGTYGTDFLFGSNTDITVDSIAPIKGKRSSILKFYVQNLPDSSATIHAHLNSIDLGLPGRWSGNQVWDTIPSWMPRGYYVPRLFNDTDTLAVSPTRFRVLVPEIIN
jgi:hypothetical protein